MTDRIRTLTVLLDRDIRTDDVEPLVAAIEHLKGVRKVELGPVTHPNEWAIKHALLMDLQSRINEMILARLKGE